MKPLVTKLVRFAIKKVGNRKSKIDIVYQKSEHYNPANAINDFLDCHLIDYVNYLIWLEI